MHLLTNPPETGNLSGSERLWLTTVEDAVNALIVHSGMSEEDYATRVADATAARVERAALIGRVEGPTTGPTMDELVDQALQRALERLGFKSPATDVPPAETATVQA